MFASRKLDRVSDAPWKTASKMNARSKETFFENVALNVTPRMVESDRSAFVKS